MDKENKKVNNAASENTQSQNNSRDEYIDGFYDLNRMYSKTPARKPVTREEELRIRDEKRREAEMKAIKEDIERRYSLQLETAQSKNNPEKPKPGSSAISRLIPEIDEKEAVREELSRIDSLIGSANIVEPVVPEASRDSSEKTDKPEEPDFDLSEKNGFYAAIYSLGDVISRFIARILLFIH